MPKLEISKDPSEVVKTHLVPLQGFFPWVIIDVFMQTVLNFWPKKRSLLFSLDFRYDFTLL